MLPRRGTDIDWRDVAARLLKPKRTRLKKVLAGVERVAREACPGSCWESTGQRRRKALSRPEVLEDAWAVVAPERWVDRRERNFTSFGVEIWSRAVRLVGGGFPVQVLPGQIPTRIEPEGQIPDRDGPLVWVGPTPTSLELVAALASDPEGVLTAESLAEEFAARMALLGPIGRFGDDARRRRMGEMPAPTSAPSRRVAWALVDPWWRFGHDDGYGRDGLGLASRYALKADDKSVPYGTYEAIYAASLVEEQARVPGEAKAGGQWRWGALLRQLMRHLTAAMQWRARTDEGLARLSPMDPLLDLYESGYFVVEMSDEWIVLGAPWDGPLFTAATWQRMGFRARW